MRAARVWLLLGLVSCSGQVMAPGTPSLPGGGGAGGGVDDPEVVVDCETSVQPPRRVRRLTRAELDTSATAAIGAPANLLAELPADVASGGFDTIADVLTVGPLFAEQLMTNAERMSGEVSAHPERFSTCRDVTVTCRDTFLRDFGARAFRRPITTSEAAEYAQLFELAKADGFATAAAFVAQAMLQSPFFVYRTELGAPATDGHWALTDDELAAELSFLITGAPPDDALRAKGAELQKPEVRRAEVERLLATAAGQKHLGDFSEKWLGLEKISFIQKSGPGSEAFDAAMRGAMLSETRALHQAAMGQGYRALLSPAMSAAPATLATYYGDGRTRGLLTLGAMMTVYGKAEASAPVQRGVAVRERLLCEELPPPPPGVDAQPPAPVPGTSARQRYAMHEALPSCQGCHARIDPIGLGFEHYDGLGRWRDDEHGVAIDASGTVFGLDGKDPTFDGVSGLEGLLSDSAQARSCYAQQWVRFGLGSLADHDGFMCLAKTAGRELSSGTVPLTTVLTALAGSERFRFRQAPAVAPMIPEEPPFVVGMPGGSSDGGTTMPPAGDLTVMRKPNSDWATGFCEDVTVTNASAMALDWRVLLTITGTVTQSWNSSYEVTPQGVAFVGAAWNKSVSPGASASFGYCANK